MSDRAPVPQRLFDSVDESSVMTYVKGLDGRYLHVNQRYQEFFGIAGDDIRGRTDDDLAPRQTIDGPRLASGSVSENEPLQLEYTVASFDGRPALAVWRFAVRAGDGDAVAVCGVAAPVADAVLARRECDRLMSTPPESNGARPVVGEGDEPQTDGNQIAALHEASASATRRAHELLTELTAERERRAEAEARGVEADELRRRVEAAESAALAERARADEADNAAHSERERADAAKAAAVAERSRADESVAELAAARGELASVGGRLEGLEAAVQAERARAEEAGVEQQLVDDLRRRLEEANEALASERAQRTHTEDEVASELLRRLQEADAALEAERARADAVRMELAAAHAELAAEHDQHARNESELISDLRAQLQAAGAELSATRAQLQTAHSDELVDDLRRKFEQTAATASQERARADAAEGALNAERADAQVRAGVAERRIAELEAALAQARAHELEVDTEHAATGPHWDASAQRAFTTALSQSSDWRVSVKSAIGVIGSRGGWDAVCAWQPDDRNGFASCFAMWTGENHRLGALETATWQRRQPLAGSTIGEALSWEESQWLTADPRAADRRIQLLAQHGIRGALIVPVRDGARPVAALELLTVGATQPSPELIDAIETMALQLGHFSHLLSAGAQPRWRFGRM